uniref:Zasp-like motif domain-containing protein n=1 Tax=Syphacia muris TaxID=451379 RepID=A0A0N5AWQ7_9BILA
MSVSVTTGAYSTMESEPHVMRKLTDRSNGYSLRRNRSPVTIKPRIQNINSPAPKADVSVEVHYAVPHTGKTIYNGHSISSRYPSAIPGPSSMTTQLLTNGNTTKHIKFEPTYQIQSNTSSSSNKYDTIQQTSDNHIIGNIYI